MIGRAVGHIMTIPALLLFIAVGAVVVSILSTATILAKGLDRAQEALKCRR